MTLSAVLLMVLSGCASAEEKRKELRQEFNSLYKLTIDGTGTAHSNFTTDASEPLEYHSIASGTYQPLQACDYIGNGKNKWVLKAFVVAPKSLTSQEVSERIDHMRQVWMDQGLEVRNVAGANEMAQIAVDTDSGLTMGYSVSPTNETINISSTCTADLDPDKQ
ncbi:hypothetical protein GCM10009567_08320 [Rothia amarae]